MPVALNLYKIRDAQGAAGDFFRSVVRQKPQYQGLWVVSPEGTVLAGHQETDDISDWYERWPKQVLADLQAGLDAFGAVEPREPGGRENERYQDALPYRGQGIRPGGGVVLAVYDKFVVVKDLTREPPADALGHTILDSIELDVGHWADLAPKQVDVETEWTVAEATARQFFPLLSTSDTTFRQADEVTSVALTGRVQAVRDGVAWLTYAGHIAGVHHGTANEGKAGNQVSAEAKLIGGVGRYDMQAGRMLSLTLVFDGLWRNYAPYDDPPGRFGAVVEWQLEKRTE